MNSSISSSELSSGSIGAERSAPGRFLVYALFTGLVGLGVMWTTTATLRDGFLPIDYASWQAKQEMIAKCDLPNTVFMGDSRAAAGFMPSRIPDSANLAMGLVTPVELYFQTRHILDCPRPPKRVVLSISIQQLERANQFWGRNALFGLMTFDDLEAIRRQSRAMNDTTLFAKATIGDIDAILNSWLITHRFPSFYFASLVNGAVVGRLSANHRQRELIVRSGGHFLYGTAPGSDDVSIDGVFPEFRVAPILDYYFKQMISLFASRGVEITFLAVPVNDATYRTISEKLEREFAGYMSSLQQQQPNFHVVGEPLRHWDNKWFGDANHLNAAGAERFSAEVAKYLTGSSEGTLAVRPAGRSD